MKRHVLAVFFAATTALVIGCGGGGTGTGSTTGGDSLTFDVRAKEPKSVTYNGKSVTVESDTDNTVTLNQVERSSDKPANVGITAATANLLITTKKVASGTFTIRYPLSGNNLRAAGMTTKGWIPLDAKAENDQLVVTLPADPAPVTGEKMPGAKEFKVFVGSLAEQSTRQPRMIHMAGNNDFHGAAIIVPGWLDGPGDFQLLANQLVTSGHYNSVFGFEYNWLDPTGESAKELAKALESIEAEVGPKQVTLIGTTTGGNVCRDTLEIQKATKVVQKLVTVGSPNNGTTMETAEEAVYRLRWQWLNSSTAWGYPELNTASVGEMLAGSTYLQELNRTQGGQVGVTDYLMVAQQQDDAVSIDSAFAFGVTLEEHTSGLIWKDHQFGDHDSLTKDPAGIDRLIAVIQKNQADSTGVTFEAMPTITEPRDSISWLTNLKVTNNTPDGAQMIDRQLVIYDGRGKWRGGWWYKPSIAPGAFFPIGYSPWQVWINPGSSYPAPGYGEDGIIIYADNNKTPIAQAPADLQCQTAYFITQIEVKGKRSKLVQKVICTYNGRMPEPAQTRMPFEVQESCEPVFARAN